MHDLREGGSGGGLEGLNEVILTIKEYISRPKVLVLGNFVDCLGGAVGGEMMGEIQVISLYFILFLFLFLFLHFFFLLSDAVIFRTHNIFFFNLGLP